MALRLAVFLLMSAVIGIVAGEEQDKQQLGSVSFENSGKPEAQETFLAGLAALHNFFYDEAEDLFQAAQKIDPGFAMAYWGEAMTHNHPLWDQQDRAAALKIIEGFLPDEAAWKTKIATERERDWMKLLTVLYGEGDDKRARDLAYLEALRRLTEKYPDDFEAKAFYALSYLGASESSEPQFERNRMRAAAVAERLVDQNPNHPGVVHYLIHAYDDPIHAPLGLPYAQKYAKVAPSAHHALHMPSHIFLQLGMWPEVVASNLRAYDASVAWAEKRGHNAAKYDYHSLAWKHYGLMQQGQLKEGRDTIDVVWAANQRVDGYYSRSSWRIMKARQLFTEEAWEDPEVTMEMAENAGRSRGPIYFALGMAAVKTGKFEQAATCIEALEAKSKDDEGTIRGAERAVLAGIMFKQLEGVLAIESGDLENGLKHLEEAARREMATSPPSGPVSPVKPALELYGDALLAAGKAADAIAQYDRSLMRTPKRPSSLFGLAKAFDATGRKEDALRLYKQLSVIWANASDDFAPAKFVQNRLNQTMGNPGTPTEP